MINDHGHEVADDRFGGHFLCYGIEHRELLFGVDSGILPHLSQWLALFNQRYQATQLGGGLLGINLAVEDGIGEGAGVAPGDGSP